MKRALFLLITFCLAYASPLLAQNQQVALSDEKLQESFPVMYNNYTILNISVVKGTTDSNGKTSVHLKIENYNAQQYVILLFGKEFDERDLKTRFKQRIVYSNNYGPHGYTEAYKLGEDNYYVPHVRIDRDHNTHEFPSLTIQDGDTVVCKLPIYIAKNKNGLFCRRTIIESETTITLSVMIETEIQKDYNRLYAKCDSLINATNDAVFCKNKLHHPSLTEQEEPYLKTRDSIRDDVRRILREYGYWSDNNRNRQNFQNLLMRLDSIDDLIAEGEVENCGDSKKHYAPHECDYCTLTLKQIYNKLDLYNKRLDNDKVSKEDVKKDVGKLYKCYRNGPKNASNKRKEQMQQYKTKIEDLYKKINSY